MTGDTQARRPHDGTAAVDAWRETLLRFCTGAEGSPDSTPEELASRGALLQRSMVQRRLRKLIRDAFPTVRALEGSDALDRWVDEWLRETGCPERRFWRVPLHFAAWRDFASREPSSPPPVEHGDSRISAKVALDALVLDATTWALRDAEDPRMPAERSADPGGRLIFLRPSAFVSVQARVARACRSVHSVSDETDDRASVDVLLSRRASGRVKGEVVPGWWRLRLEELAASDTSLAETMDLAWSTLPPEQTTVERAEFVPRLAALIREDLVTTIGVDTAGLTPGDKSAPRLWRATDLLRGPTTLAATPCNEPGAGQTHDGARAEAPGAGTAPRATAPPIHTESITETPP